MDSPPKTRKRPGRTAVGQRGKRPPPSSKEVKVARNLTVYVNAELLKGIDLLRNRARRKPDGAYIGRTTKPTAAQIMVQALIEHLYNNLSMDDIRLCAAQDTYPAKQYSLLRYAQKRDPELDAAQLEAFSRAFFGLDGEEE